MALFRNFSSTFRRILIALLAAGFSTAPVSASILPFRVVLDPGHGGSDEGTIFDNGPTRISEKEITLQLAREVAVHLRSRGFLVHLTREDDHELPLPDRTALANRLGADAFISIHTNSIQNRLSRDAEGVETYILDNATDASSRRLARLENKVTMGNLSPEDMPEKSDVALILKDLRLDANLFESKNLACSIQNRLVSATSSRTSPPSIRNRGVKQALFHVLLGADMPSILVEAGFLSNARDRALLLTPGGRKTISRAVADALEEYRRHKVRIPQLVSIQNCKVN